MSPLCYCALPGHAWDQKSSGLEFRNPKMVPTCAMLYLMRRTNSSYRTLGVRTQECTRGVVAEMQKRSALSL